jgi:phage tail-like protein
MAASVANALRIDPVLNFNFVIKLIDSSSSLALGSIASGVLNALSGGFSECSGLEMSLDVEEYREGGRNSEVLQFPTRIRWSKMTLKRGIAVSTDLWDWHYSFVEGKGKRRDGLVILLNNLHVPNNIWYFRRGLPVRYTVSPMNATQSSVAVESLEIAHEGIFQLPGIGIGGAAVSISAAAAV